MSHVGTTYYLLFIIILFFPFFTCFVLMKKLKHQGFHLSPHAQDLVGLDVRLLVRPQIPTSHISYENLSETVSHLLWQKGTFWEIDIVPTYYTIQTIMHIHISACSRQSPLCHCAFALPGGNMAFQMCEGLNDFAQVVLQLLWQKKKNF